MRFGDVAQAQCDRINPCLMRQFIHRIFKRQHAHGLARCAHGSRTCAVHPRDAVRIGAVFTRVQKVRGQCDGFAERFTGQVRYRCIVADRGQMPLCICRQPQPLLGRTAPHRGLEHLRARHHNAHRTAQRLGRDCGPHGFGGQAKFRTKAAADIGGQKPDIGRINAQGIGQFIPVIFQHLIGPVQRQLVAFPAGNRGMRLHRGTGLGRGGIIGVDTDMRGSHGGVHIALFRLLGLWRVYLRRPIKRIGDSLFNNIGNGNILRCMAGLLKGFSHNKRDGLAEIRNIPRALNGCFVRGALGRVSQQAFIRNKG